MFRLRIADYESDALSSSPPPLVPSAPLPTSLPRACESFVVSLGSRLRGPMSGRNVSLLALGRSGDFDGSAPLRGGA
jgi:hypothetical protein